MKICLMMPNVFPVPATKGGATEMLITNLLKQNEIEKKIEFICVSVYEEKAKELSKNYKNTKFIYINNEREKEEIDLTFSKEDVSFKNYMDEVYKNVKDIDFDYLIIEGGDITGYEYLLKKFPRKKCLVHIHGDALGDNKINTNIYEYFIAISQYTKKLIMGDQIIPAERIKLLYNAINLEDFEKEITLKEKKELRTKYGIKENDIVIMFSGRTIPQKGVKELISSFKKMRNIEKCKLLIVGNANYSEQIETPYDRELKQMSMEIQDKIKFTGYIANQELYKIHRISDIAVVPSMWEELFGLVVVEDMCSGLPIIATKSGGIPEIVNEDCAYIVKKDSTLIDQMKEKLDYLVENPEVRKKMGEAGKRKAKEYGMKSYYNNFIDLVKSLNKGES